jgi:tetratricopeptide (TPR) repeat protein
MLAFFLTFCWNKNKLSVKWSFVTIVFFKFTLGIIIKDGGKTVKNNFLAKYARWGNWLLIFCIINILTVTDLLAVSIQTIDKDGIPSYSTEQIKRDPDRFIENMKTDLRYGNLDSIGFLAERLIEVKSDVPDVRALYSIFLSSKEDVEKARQELKKATESRKESQYSLYAKAMILRLEKQYSAAIKACKKAITMDKSHPYPWNILGRIYFDRQEYKKAIASFQKAVELSANFMPAYVNLGAVSFLMGDRTQSINHFQKAIKLNPNSYSAHYGLAVVYESEGKIFLALEEFKKSLELNPGNPTALQKLGELQLKAEKYKDALSTGEKMAKQGVEGAYEILGDAALHLGDKKEAIRYLEKAPVNSYTADYLRGFCFMAEGNHKDALKYMENVLQKNKEHFGAYAARIALKFYLGQRIDPEKALSKKWGETLDKLLYFMAGSVYAADENWSDAMKNWIAAENLIGGFSVQGIDIDTLAKGVKKDEFRHLIKIPFGLITGLHRFT